MALADAARAVVQPASFLYTASVCGHIGCVDRSVMPHKATWRSGYAAVCKTAYPGSIPGVASSRFRAQAVMGRHCRAGLGEVSVLRVAVLMLAALALVGCSSYFVYLRADGQDMTANPALYQQFDMDRTSCQAAANNASAPNDSRWSGSSPGGVTMNDCMENKGYIVVSTDAASMRQQQLAAEAAEKARRAAEAAAPPPPPPPPPPPHHAAKAKPKPKPKPKAEPPASAPPPPVQTSPKS